MIPEKIRDNPNNKDSIKSKQETYLKFYNSNLELNISIIDDISKIEQKIGKYIDLKIEERIEVFGEE